MEGADRNQFKNLLEEVSAPTKFNEDHKLTCIDNCYPIVKSYENFPKTFAWEQSSAMKVTANHPVFVELNELTNTPITKEFKISPVKNRVIGGKVVRKSRLLWKPSSEKIKTCLARMSISRKLECFGKPFLCNLHQNRSLIPFKKDFSLKHAFSNPERSISSFSTFDEDCLDFKFRPEIQLHEGYFNATSGFDVRNRTRSHSETAAFLPEMNKNVELLPVLACEVGMRNCMFVYRRLSFHCIQGVL